MMGVIGETLKGELYNYGNAIEDQDFLAHQEGFMNAISEWDLACYVPEQTWNKICVSVAGLDHG